MSPDVILRPLGREVRAGVEGFENNPVYEIVGTSYVHGHPSFANSDAIERLCEGKDGRHISSLKWNNSFPIDLRRESYRKGWHTSPWNVSPIVVDSLQQVKKEFIILRF
jgi:hypothetical protein